MIAAALCLALAQSGHAVDDAPLVSTSGYGSAHWRLPGGSREVGQPFEAVLVVPHARSDQVALDASALEDDPGWIVLDGPRPVARERADWLAPEESAFAFTLASLEPGERELPPVTATLTLSEGELALVHGEGARAEFSGVLAPDEDAPRAPRGFARIEPASLRALSPAVAAAAALIALATAAVAWLALRRRRARPQTPPTFEERLADLERRDFDSREVAREVHYELTRLVRGEVDARTGARRDALTDDEWLRAVAQALDSERVRELEALMRASEEVKYGAHAPTAWAVRETIERARRAARAGRASAEASP